MKYKIGNTAECSSKFCNIVISNYKVGNTSTVFGIGTVNVRA